VPNALAPTLRSSSRLQRNILPPWVSISMSTTLVPLAVPAPAPEKLTPPIERPCIERSVAITDKRSLDGDRCSACKSTVALMYALNEISETAAVG
jgi:hypothetical protein